MNTSFVGLQTPMETPVVDRNLIIKVKYGDTLRRFSASVRGQAMDYDMNKLRAKIIDLFKFRPDIEFVLTYSDEDGDTVTLDNDDELRDAAVSQQLNPLRIHVHMKSHADGTSTKSEPAPSNPTESPRILIQESNVSSAINEALESLPEPLRGTLSKLSEDLLSKATSSSPAIADFVEYFSKLGLSNAGHASRSPTGESSGPVSGASAKDLNVSEKQKFSHDPSPGPIRSSVPAASEPLPKQDELVDVEQPVGTKLPTSADYNIDIPMNLHASGYPSVDGLLSTIWTTDNMELRKETSEVPLDQKSVIDSLYVPPLGQTLECNLGSFEIPKPACPPIYGIAGGFVGGSSSHFTAGAMPQTSEGGVNAPLSRDIDPPLRDVPSWFYPPAHPYRRAHVYHDTMFRTFHRGVQCDGCGMHPIMGPRFKSNVKEDYDLCSICFSQMGNEADYTRIERAPYRSQRLAKECFPHPRCRPSSHAVHGCGPRSSRAKLDSRFIQDVTVLDGTSMSPLTPFTKIWRMRNNGTISWPFGTQLVWIGGDQLGNRGSIELEIPLKGCSVDDEIDIAVDFTAPSRAGRYISYWRMASPTGQKFGQRVWVLIQIENSRPNSSAGSSLANINLNLPPENTGRNGLVPIDMNADPLDGVFAEHNHTNINAEEVVEPSNAKIPIENVNSASLNELMAVVNEPAQPTSKSPAISYPIIDFPEPSNASLIPMASSSALAAEENTVEQTLLKELEEMGFKQIDLNKEILRLNEYDLEQSVDDLCGFAEWDPLLSELQEMGFGDKEKNKKLLIKNGGSIKRVVLDLIADEKNGEKAE